MTSRSAIATATRAESAFGLREFLFGSAAAIGALSVGASPTTSPVNGIDLQSPLSRLRTLIRLQGSLEEVDCPWWYSGTIYGVTTSFMKTITGAPARSMVNPYTGKTVTPVTNRLGGRGYSRRAKRA